MNAKEFLKYIYKNGYKNRELLRNKILPILKTIEKTNNIKKMEKIQRRICDRVKIPFFSSQRKIVMERFYNILCNHDKTEQKCVKKISKIAKEIESVIYQRYVMKRIYKTIRNDNGKKEDKKYRERFQKLYTNLKDQNNFELRKNLILGNISPKKFVSMSDYDLASPNIKELRSEAQKQAWLEVIPRNNIKKENTMQSTQSCPECNSRNTFLLHQFQTRSADEPMTEYYNCEMCDHNWTIG